MAGGGSSASVRLSAKHQTFLRGGNFLARPVVDLPLSVQTGLPVDLTGEHRLPSLAAAGDS
jgi:hypothetical protein